MEEGRKPHLRARPTPSNTAIKTPKNLNHIPNFPINNIDLQNQNQQQNPNNPPLKQPSNSLNVFLRIRPLSISDRKLVHSPPKNPKLKQVPEKKRHKSCVVVNGCNCVTVWPPKFMNSNKSEVFDGFSHVFASDSSQDEVYEKLMRPMVAEFLNGRSGLLAALGPSGSGKTHTVFGSANDPGLVPRVLRQIFVPDKGKPSVVPRLFYLSIYEICSEKGKGEKFSDLSPEGYDKHMQQSVVNGLKEIVVKDVAQAESIIAYAKSKRATAMTNSNSLSSRSQCIINICCAPVEAEGEGDIRRSEAVLTFVDLAGAEREKKTGNKGVRLLESNFINNTSMVFCMCLRSLLKHQQNPKNPLQNHVQSTLLTRHLRDYLEGRKRMALILTVRAEEEDYVETSFLLRQASPYMKIKFCDVEETFNLPHIKKRRHIIGNEQQKRAKLNGADARDDVEMTCKDSKNFPKEIPGGNKKNNASRVGVNLLPEVECTVSNSNLQRQYNIMQDFPNLWAMLKQHEKKVKTMQKDIDFLTDNLKVGYAQCLVMEKELLNLKSHCSCPKQVVGVASCPMGGPNSESMFSEVPTDLRVISAEVQDIADIDCKEKEILHTAGKDCTSHLECERVRLTAPEDPLQCSTTECKSTTLLWEKNVHFVGEVYNSSTPKAGFPCIDSAGISASKEENRLKLESADVQDSLGGISRNTILAHGSSSNRACEERPLKPIKKLRRINQKWSDEEVFALGCGYDMFGPRWTAILQSYPEVFIDRTNIDLKDKWRNMNK